MLESCFLMGHNILKAEESSFHFCSEKNDWNFVIIRSEPRDKVLGEELIKSVLEPGSRLIAHSERAPRNLGHMSKVRAGQALTLSEDLEKKYWKTTQWRHLPKN